MQQNNPHNFLMPAEWELHEATWISWPYDTTSFPDLKPVENAYVAIITALTQTENVHLLVTDKQMQEYVQTLLATTKYNASHLFFHILPYMDVWIRDYGPIFVVNKQAKQLAITKWQFNAWGNKYPELLSDNEIPEFINKELQLPYFDTNIILEGGSIDVNGQGALLTTEQCLLNNNRNNTLSKTAIEQKLQEYLGVRKIIWLKEGLIGDDTDGHVDDIARFVNPTTILCAFEENPEDENYHILKENYEILEQSTDQAGNAFTLIKLPMPKAKYDGDRRLPLSYANFYIGNSCILCPTFEDANDTKVITILASVFPDRKVVGIPATKFVYGNGAFHCATQQQPLI